MDENYYDVSEILFDEMLYLQCKRDLLFLRFCIVERIKYNVMQVILFLSHSPSSLLRHRIFHSEITAIKLVVY
jgi:hypothetical protein